MTFLTRKMKKKICIIHKVNVLDPRSYYKEGRSLSKAGYDVKLLGLFENNQTINGINIIGIKYWNSPQTKPQKLAIINPTIDNININPTYILSR